MYKKYIYKNGRKLGPYYYESKRIGNSIKTVYLGSKPRKVALHKHNKSRASKLKYNNSLNYGFLVSFLLLISLLGLVFIKDYTGFAVAQPYTDALNLNINQSQSYTWKVQNQGNLAYLKLSGSILGQGKAKIYVQNNNLTYLIFDSSNSNLLTGLIIEPDIYSIVDTSKKDKTKEKTHENLTLPSQNISENITVENISISEVYELVNTSKQENLTLINQSETSQSNLNLTENPSIIRFENACIETCSLTNFSSDNYTLIFELENATILLDNLEYSLNIPETVIETPINISMQENLSIQNITNITLIENLTNLTLENLTLFENLTNITLEDIYNLSKLEIKDSKKQKLNYKIVKREKDSLEIEIFGKNIKSMKFEGVRNLTELYLEELPENEIKDKQFKKIYAVNPTLLDFDNATLTIKATGNELYKCKDWNFTEQKCYGSWQSLRYITPNLDYTLTITKEDPAFGEIEISNATHLDNNYNFISNIYDLVKSKDNIWSEPVYNGQYVRVTFVQNLTNGNDITLYARNLYGAKTTIEVYHENSNEKIAEFPLINIEDYYQIIFENLTDSYPTFDLKIKSIDPNAYLEFDHIIDPISSVTLNDPTNGNRIVWSSQWFWMNCTAAKQGQGDTPDLIWFQSNNSVALMTGIPVNLGTSTLNTSSTNPIDPFLYATMYSINVSTPNANGYQVRCLANNSAGTTVTSVVRKVTVLQTNVSFNQSTLSLSANQGETQSFLQTANITSYGTNNDVNVSCLTGSCSTITTNFTQADLTDNQTKYAFFNCSTSTVGFFSANYTVNSTEYQNSTLSNTKQINVSCSIIDEIIPPNILIRNPSNNSVLISNKTYVNYTYGTDANSIWYELDSNDTNITITKGTNITFIDLSLAIHNISVFANDSSNNINSSFINFSIRDATPPDILIRNPSNNTVIANTTVQVNYTYGTDANTIWYELDSNNTNITITIGSNITFTNLANAVYNVTLYANDSSNNINSSFINFSINYIAPLTYCNGNFNNSKAVFNINSNVECANETMDIDGNITVLSGGNLTFKNITLRFTGAGADGYNYINKTENGGLWILDNDNNQSTSNDASNITAKNPNFEYDFWIFGNGANDNFTLQNSIITEFGVLNSAGIYLYNVSNISIIGNIIDYTISNGLFLINSNGNNISNNYINTSVVPSFAIVFSSSSDSRIFNNNITTSLGGIISGNKGINLSLNSNSNIIEKNNITSGISGALNPNHAIIISSSNSNSIINNIISSNGGTVTNYGIRLNSANSTNISGNIIETDKIKRGSGNSPGISLVTTIQNSITHNIIKTYSNNSDGILLSSSSNNNITNNTINLYRTLANINGIIVFQNSNNNLISSNNITENATVGIYLGKSSLTSEININNNKIIDNIISNSTTGIFIASNTSGNSASNSNYLNHTIENNNITFTENAIYISNSSNINISLGTIRNSTNGIVLFNSKQVNATNITFTSNTYDFNITNSSSLTSINNSFNKTVKVMDLSNFTIMWFAEVYINDNQSGTNVSVWNTTGARHGNSTTNAQGLTPLFLLTEYIRNNTDNLTSNNPFNFTADNTTFFNSTIQNIDQSKRVTISFLAGPAGANTAPTVNNLTLTPSFPNTTINLNCSFIITDPNADTLTVNLTWYKNSTINKTYSGISVTNGTVNQHYLNNANTTKNDNWSCGVRPYDTIAWGNEVNSSTVTIQNSQPSTPALSSPPDGNKTTNRTEAFYWNAATDPDNDPITYTINISCWGGCSADNRLVNTTSINYTPAELRFFLDDNYYYNWTVKSFDSDANSSAYAAERNLSIISQVSISLPNSTILFGTRSLSDVFDTLNNTPNPIVIQNDGNSYVNVNLSAQSMLFTTKPNPSTNYRYKIDNTTVEAGSFNFTSSVTTWTNIPLQNNTAINLLNYSNSNDTAEMDIQITVPLDEPPGNLTSNLILTGYYTAYYP